MNPGKEENLMRMFLLAAIFLSFTTLAAAQEPRHAIVVKVEGQVEVRIKEGAWEPAQAGGVLNEGDEIRTEKGSKAEILLDKEGASGQLELKPESRLRINTMDLNQQTLDKTTFLDLAIGSVLVHAEKLQGDSKFQVRTPNSTTGVRGTTFIVSAKPKEEQSGNSPPAQQE